MTLAEQVQRSLSNAPPAAAGRHTRTFAFPDAGWAVAATLEKSESVGGAVWELALDRTAPAPDGLTVKGWAGGVAALTGGLLERLKVYEIDGEAALLRSDAPQARGTARAYYEVTLEGTAKATVRRFQSDTTPGSKRAQVPYALTYEAIGLVAEGIVGG